MTSGLALVGLERALAAGVSELVVADVEWSRFRKLYEATSSRRRLLVDVEREPLAPFAPVKESVVWPAEPDNGGRPSPAKVLAIIVDELCRMTGIHRDDLDVEQPINTMGIDSLSGLELKAALASAFRVEVPVVRFLEGIAAGELAVFVSETAPRESGVLPSERMLRAASVVAVDHPTESTEVGLSFAQQRLWFLDRLEGGGPLYNVPAAVRIRGALRVDILAETLDVIVQRHAVFRTCFREEDGRPLTEVRPRCRVPVEVRDLRALEPEARESAAMLLARSAARVPFDLGSAPLVRACVIRLADDDRLVVLSMHHIASDGWSVGVLIHEIAAIYRAVLSGRDHDLPTLKLQYGEFARRHNALVESDAVTAQLAFWKKKLEHAPVLSLPTDRPRPSARSSDGALVPFELGPELSEGIRLLARQEGTTVFTVLLAAFNAFLHRYTNQDEICIGVPVAGRDESDTHALIGFFVNTLVMRSRVERTALFRELLAHVRSTVLEAFANQDAPFDKVVAAVRPERNMSHTPLFQAGMVFQNAPVGALALAGLEIQPVDIDPGVSKFDLHLTWRTSAAGIDGTLEYSSDLFEPATAQRMVEHLRELVASAIAEPGRTVAALSLMSAQERETLVTTWNDTAVQYPLDVNLHELVEAQVRETPERIALTFEQGSMTYAELNNRANALARELVARGAGEGTFVAVSIERSFELVIALLAVVKAGAAYVPLEPSYPEDRLAFMMEDAGAPILLASRAVASGLPSDCGHVFVVDRATMGLSIENLGVHVAPTSPAYMIYTSGSTGRPKGAINGHAGICNRFFWMQDAFKLGGDDVVLQKTPFGFDVSVWEFFWPLMTGARLAIAKPGGHRDARYLVDVMVRERVTTLHFVPSMLRAFLEEPSVERLTDLRRVVCSGEALPSDLTARFFDVLDTELHNLYGPTEAAVDVSWWECAHEDGRRSVPIGRPIANTQLYMLDQALQPVPIGVPGELHIGGVQVGLGYHKRLELTDEKFIPSPFASGQKLYKTGDLTRWLPTGVIEYLGRLDHQIKLRGLRIELAEIEAVLSEHAAVRESVVVPRGRGDAIRLVAYVVGNGVEPVAADLATLCAARLPEFMVPSAFVVLSALPLSPNGKIDRARLPEPAVGDGTERVEPRDDVEREIARIWQELLGVPVGIRDSFFSLGGDSLLAVRVVARIQQRFGIVVPVASLFKTPTVEKLAAAVRGDRGDVPEDTALVELQAAKRGQPPVFFIHPAGGDVFCYAGLAHGLRPRRGFYALRAPALSGGQPPCSTVQEIATSYLALIRAKQAQGPYLLGGWSMGGVVAYEMAHQLTQAGEKVDTLLIVDSMVGQRAPESEVDRDRLIAAMFINDLMSLLGLELYLLDASFWTAELDTQLDMLFETARASGPPEVSLERADLQIRYEVFHGHVVASWAYQPPPYASPVTLIRAEETVAAADPATSAAWRKVAPQLQESVVPGNHYSMLRGPGLESVASAAGRALERQTV